MLVASEALPETSCHPRRGAAIVPDELLGPEMSILDGSGSMVAGGSTTVLGPSWLLWIETSELS